jgi:gamma-glutamyltranspeptidase/glutathione hydrolase
VRQVTEVAQWPGGPVARIILRCLTVWVLWLGPLGHWATGPLSAQIPDTWRYRTVTPAVVGAHAMVAADHPISSQVGADILQHGGNAIDAIVAVAFAHAVVQPSSGNIGGGGFLVYRQRNGRAYALDFREVAPAAATRDMFINAAGQVSDDAFRGPRSSGVPGSVAGLWEMHRRFGHLPWRDVVAPAIALARDGYVLDGPRGLSLARMASRFQRYGGTARAFVPQNRPYGPGDTLRQPDLAQALERIAATGRDGFYTGRTADLIVAEMQRLGGLITKADLAAYRPAWRTPVRGTYRGYGIISMPPVSSGGVTIIQALNILSGFQLPPFNSAEERHLVIEAERRAFADRNRLLGDPAFTRLPITRLTSRAYARLQRSTIDTARATPTDALPLHEGSNTTNYSVVDAAGNAAALTTTINNGFGSLVLVEGAGFFLNDEMDDFTAQIGAVNTMGLQQVGEPNTIAPGKRMLSSMTPTVVLDRHGRLFMVLGSEGGAWIITAVLEAISNVIDHHMTLAEALHAPRTHHNALPDSVEIETDALTPEVRSRLEAMGHHFAQRTGYNATVTAVMVTPHGLEGVTDPRQPSRAAGY